MAEGTGGGNVVSFSTAGKVLGANQGRALNNFTAVADQGWHHHLWRTKESGYSTTYVTVPAYSVDHLYASPEPAFNRAGRQADQQYSKPELTLTMEPVGMSQVQVNQKVASTAEKDVDASKLPKMEALLSRRKIKAASAERTVSQRFRKIARTKKALFNSKSNGGVSR